jgi:hypothetical protein
MTVQRAPNWVQHAPQPAIRHGQGRSAAECKSGTGTGQAVRFAAAQGDTARPKAIQRGERHRLCQAVAEPDDLRRYVVPIARGQYQAIADRYMPAQPIDIDHEARKTDHPSFQMQRSNRPHRGPAGGAAIKERCISH